MNVNLQAENCARIKSQIDFDPVHPLGFKTNESYESAHGFVLGLKQQAGENR